MLLHGAPTLHFLRLQYAVLNRLCHPTNISAPASKIVALRHSNLLLYIWSKWGRGLESQYWGPSPVFEHVASQQVNQLLYWSAAYGVIHKIKKHVHHYLTVRRGVSISLRLWVIVLFNILSVWTFWQGQSTNMGPYSSLLGIFRPSSDRLPSCSVILMGGTTFRVRSMRDTATWLRGIVNPENAFPMWFHVDINCKTCLGCSLYSLNSQPAPVRVVLNLDYSDRSYTVVFHRCKCLIWLWRDTFTLVWTFYMAIPSKYICSLSCSSTFFICL